MTKLQHLKCRMVALENCGENCQGMSDEEVAECYVSFAEGNGLDLCFDRNVISLGYVSSL